MGGGQPTLDPPQLPLSTSGVNIHQQVRLEADAGLPIHGEFEPAAFGRKPHLDGRKSALVSATLGKGRSGGIYDD